MNRDDKTNSKRFPAKDKAKPNRYLRGVDFNNGTSD